MANQFNLDGIKTALSKDIAIKRRHLEAWEKVTFPTKKDGKPFAQMSKNIDGAKYEPVSYGSFGQYELTIHLWVDGAGYTSDCIYCYEYVEDLKDETRKAKTENYMARESYLKQLYKYDLDDIKQAIKVRIEYLKQRIASLEKQLEIADHCYNAFKEAFGTALADLEKNCMEAGDSGFSGNRNDIYYMILDTVKERFPYC